MLRNILIAAAALSTIALGSAGTASATGYYNKHFYGHNYYKPHHKVYVKKHYVKKHFVKKHYNYDYNWGHNDGYYVQNDCGWQTVKVIRWNHGYRYVDFVKTWTCY